MDRIKTLILTNPVTQWIIGLMAAIAASMDFITQIPLDDLVNACYILIGTAALSIGTMAFKKLADRNAKH